MKHQRTRDYRRSVRARAIAHAFDIYWHSWGECDDAFKAYRYYDHCRIILDHEQARWYYEDQHRIKVLDWAKQAADNMRLCSCFLCSGYKKYEKTPQDLREAARDACDFEELEKWISGSGPGT